LHFAGTTGPYQAQGIEYHIRNGTVAKPARQFGHAMQILNQNHYFFL
jgi:hypothetical protein